ncbi:Inositol 2-dehydrogenase [Posidoniimonas polymericola]|uniref:Inositol 2-dehydrogenase n=1 Tax=Posidoniimonas polymericola TaxID=2528002 RepID=A0A5C5XUT7_9BACT|nr:Gfo/Idh/MocA family oxidoreductase [Posidoniimonas polymericola]TWT66331.1 Inositol 2-dehydrogenase [Posidoniimonas polymericola]
MGINRRGFLASTGAVAAANLFHTGVSLAAPATASPNEQPVVGFIGTGIRFHTALGHQATALGPCAKIADVDAAQAGRAWQTVMDLHRDLGRPIDMTVHEDYQRVLDDKHIDVVVVGSADHWHTKHVIDAVDAGKDVYCEKPLTLTIAEGRQIEEAIARTGRIVQVGTQQRTEFGQMFTTAAAMVRDGRVGGVKRVTVCIGGSRDAEPLPVTAPPKQLNWDKWLGQCPMVDYRESPTITDTSGWGAGHPFSRTHHYFRWWYEYSGGKLTDWGAHHVDIAMLALDKQRDDIGHVKIEPISVTHPVEFVDGMPAQDDRFNAATAFNVRCTFADGIEMDIRDNAVDDLGFDNGVMFTGDKGRFLVNRGKLVGAPVEALGDRPLPADPFQTLYGQAKPKSHMDHFFDCVKSRTQPISDVPSHNRMLNVCHAVNIAMRLGRTLTYDPATQSFVGDKQANSFVAREQRKGYETA